MAKIQKVEPLVFKALLEIPATRDNDFLLIHEVLKNFVDTKTSISTALNNHVIFGLPSFASIIRIRRKLQTKYPELESTKVKEQRKKEEQEYRTYAKI